MTRHDFRWLYTKARAIVRALDAGTYDGSKRVRVA